MTKTNVSVASEAAAPRVWVTFGYRDGKPDGRKINVAYEVRNGLREAGFSSYLISTDRDFVELAERHENDVVFPIEELYPHPGFEEDPVGVRRALEGLAIPFVGSSAAAVLRAWNKVSAKKILDEAGLDVPAGIHLDGSVEDVGPVVEDFGLRFPGPKVLKPVTGRGGSIGVEYLPDEEALRQAIEHWSSSGRRPVMIEEYVDGVEATAWVMGTGEGLRCTQVLELERSTPIFDRDSKHQRRGALRPSRNPVRESSLTAEVVQAIISVSLSAHRALGAYSYSRVDLIMRDGRPVILEANTRPTLGFEGGMSIADGTSMSFTQALSELVQHARVRSEAASQGREDAG